MFGPTSFPAQGPRAHLVASLARLAAQAPESHRRRVFHLLHQNSNSKRSLKQEESAGKWICRAKDPLSLADPDERVLAGVRPALDLAALHSELRHALAVLPRALERILESSIVLKDHRILHL